MGGYYVFGGKTPQKILPWNGYRKSPHKYLNEFKFNPIAMPKFNLLLLSADQNLTNTEHWTLSQSQSLTALIYTPHCSVSPYNKYQNQAETLKSRK